MAASSDAVSLYHDGTMPRGGVYESQAGYLEQRDLLLPGERRRLRDADFEPEVIPAPSTIELDQHGRFGMTARWTT
jgi:hypothetical protein